MVTQTYHTTCFLCGGAAQERETDHANRRLYRCPKCGDYEISRKAMGRLTDSPAFKARASEAAAAVKDPDKIYEITIDNKSGDVLGTVVVRRQELR